MINTQVIFSPKYPTCIAMKRDIIMQLILIFMAHFFHIEKNNLNKAKRTRKGKHRPGLRSSPQVNVPRSRLLPLRDPSARRTHHPDAPTPPTRGTSEAGGYKGAPPMRPAAPATFTLGTISFLPPRPSTSVSTSDLLAPPS